MSLAGRSTTIRISRETKSRLERIALMLGVSLMEALDYVVSVAEKHLEEYQGDLEVLARILGDTRGSGYKDTSVRVDEVLANALLKESKDKR